MSHVPDLVQDTKLDTSFADNFTVHHHDDSDDEGFTRSVRRVEYWEYTQLLARGGCGEVWLQKCTRGKRAYEWRAVKVIPTNDRKVKQMNYVSELEAIAKFSQKRYSKCFVKLLGWYDSTDALFIAMEYFPLGDLQQYMSNNNAIPEADVQEVTYQILDGLHFMHREGFAHRDIKPGNVLIKSRPPSKWWVKLSDFGISKRIDSMEVLSTVKGTVSYMAPELFGYEPGGTYQINFQASDMWSLGELVFRMLTKKATFPTHGALFRYLARPDLFPSQELKQCHASKEVDSFIREVMKPAPESRLQARGALDHAWIQACRASEATIATLPMKSPINPTDGLSTVLPESTDPWATVSSTATGLPRTTSRSETGLPTRLAPVPSHITSTDQKSRSSYHVPIENSAMAEGKDAATHQATSVPQRPQEPSPGVNAGPDGIPGRQISPPNTASAKQLNKEASDSLNDPRSMTLQERLRYLAQTSKSELLLARPSPSTAQEGVAKFPILSLKDIPPPRIQIKRLYGLNENVVDFLFTPNSRQLVLAQKDLRLDGASISLTVHDTHYGDRARQISLRRKSEVLKMAVTEGGENGLAALARSRGGLELWSLPHWQFLAEALDKMITALAFRPKSNDTIAVASGHELRLYKLVKRSNAYTLREICLLFSPSTMDLLRRPKAEFTIEQISFTPDGNTVGALSRRGVMLLKQSSNELWELLGEVGSPTNIVSFQLHARPDSIVYVDELGIVKMLNTSSLVPLWPLEFKPEGGSRSVAISPDAQLVAVATTAGATILDQHGSPLANTPGSNFKTGHMVRFSPDGKYLAAGGVTGRLLVVWEIVRV